MENKIDKIQYIKDRLTLTELAEREGVKLIRASANTFKALCCLHYEKTPSLTFFLKTRSFKCFGCGEFGDVITLYAKRHGRSNKEAIGELYEQLTGIRKEGIKPHDGEQTSSFVSIGDALTGLKLREERRAILPPKDIYSSLKEFCGELDSESREYLNKRGLNDETIKHFGIFSIKDYKKTRQYLLSLFNLERLKETSLFSEYNRFLFVKHKIITPLIEDGEIVALRGRYFYNGSAEVPEASKSYTGKYNSTFGIYGKLFNGDILKTLPKGSPLFLCEGEFDTMALHQHGKNAVGLLGVALYTEEMIARLKDFDLIIAFDNDEAGEDHAKRVNFIYNKLSGRIAKSQVLPEGIKDITELYLSRELAK